GAGWEERRGLAVALDLKLRLMGLVPTLVGWRKSSRGLLSIQRRGEKERRPLIRTALKINYPPVLLNNQLGNREPQTIATHLRLLHVVRLVKTLKNMLAILHRNTKTRIDHRDQRELLIIRTSTNNHLALGRREFDRISHQVI